MPSAGCDRFSTWIHMMVSQGMPDAYASDTRMQYGNVEAGTHELQY